MEKPLKNDSRNAKKGVSNTDSPSSRDETPLLHWFFTIPCDKMYQKVLNDLLNEKCEKYMYQQENGSKTGYIHWQGHMTLKRRQRRETVNNWLGPYHIEPTRSKKGGDGYCSKGDTYMAGPWYKGYPKPVETITESMLYEWQRKIEAYILGPIHPRQIPWWWEPVGNVGKTEFVKYLLLKYSFIEYCCAKSSRDILTVANPEKTVYLLHFTREREEGTFTPWEAIESLKDGLISDSKLKKTCRNVIMNRPHVIIFANWPPPLGKLSADRFIVERIPT